MEAAGLTIMAAMAILGVGGIAYMNVVGWLERRAARRAKARTCKALDHGEGE